MNMNMNMSFTGSCCNPDIFSWIRNLPQSNQWRSNSISICICSSGSSSQPSLHLSVTRNPNSPLFFSIVANFNLPISLWSSKPLKLNPESPESTILHLLRNIIEDVLSYGPTKHSPNLRIPKLDSIANLKDVFNLSFFTLSFLICIYEAPADLRSRCLHTLKNHLTTNQLRTALKTLMKLLGSNLEEQWMRSVNLAITNWIVELQGVIHTLKTPSPLFSYAISTYGLWKVQLYCPVIAMDIQSTSNPNVDERLQFSLNYHQLEGVIQFNYQVRIKQNWIDVIVNIDNIRCDIIKLINETLLAEQGTGAAEKHFPSRICVQLTPTLQTNVLSVSVGKSSENPTREIGFEKSIEGSFEPSNPFPGISISAGETTTVSLKPWKFEQSVNGYSANMNWYLHDSMDGREVFSSRPSKLALINPRSWFKDRYASAYRPFTRQGGVVFAGDEYGENVWWKMERGAMGKSMEFEVRGWIWVTYWPNKHRTFHSETRRLEFRETLNLIIA